MIDIPLIATVAATLITLALTLLSSLETLATSRFKAVVINLIIHQRTH